MRINIFVFVLALTSCSETFETRNINHDEAKLLIKQGWLPAWLPPESTGIYEKHNIDSNRSISKVSMPLDALPPLGCVNSKLVPPRPALEASWFPKDISKKGTRYQYFKCNQGVFFAVDSGTSTVYYWSLGI